MKLKTVIKKCVVVTLSCSVVTPGEALGLPDGCDVL